MTNFVRPLMRAVRLLCQDRQSPDDGRESKRPMPRPVARLRLERLEERITPSSLIPSNPC